MSLPRISIVTPSCNSVHYIEETIDSVLSQGYSNLEYIIVDGGSSDGTVDIIRKYSKYLRSWSSEPDSGQADAIQKGFRRCTGDIFNWLNADDSYKPGALALVAQAFKDPAVNVYAAKSHVYGLGKSYLSNGTTLYPNNLERTVGRARIDQPETFFRRSIIEMLGGVNTNLHYLMDLELWIRYLLSFGLTGIVQSDDVIVNFRLHADSKTVSQQDGFAQEANLLASIILDSFPSPLCPELVQTLAINPLDIDLDEVRRELAFLRYASAYAERDWTAMLAWRQRLNALPFSLQFYLQSFQLECRRLLLHPFSAKSA